jgi:transcriptional regulator NrdR family protein
MNEQQPRPAERPDEQRGIVCAKCGCQHFRVVYTRPGWGSRIIRRRECRNCGWRVTTYERAGA